MAFLCCYVCNIFMFQECLAKILRLGAYLPLPGYDRCTTKLFTNKARRTCKNNEKCRGETRQSSAMFFARLRIKLSLQGEREGGSLQPPHSPLLTRVLSMP